jgi:D-serine deaminase-like pyridoxal phosphate-dependent protein
MRATPGSPRDDRYDRFRRALGDEPLPLAIVDLDALDHNLAALLAPLRGRGKTLRIASKSIRCPALLRYLLDRGGTALHGLMAYSCAEARFLASHGFDDILVAYPTAQASDARLVAGANRDGARVSLAVDCVEHLAVASSAAVALTTTIPVIIDVDVSYRPLGGRIHIGVRRSPLHTAREVGELAARIATFPGLEFAGILGYEAHLAGLPDHTPSSPLLDAPRRAVKALSRAPVLELRREIASELARRGIALPLFNGGGTGSVAWTAQDPSLTELTAGSGFLDSHLFDHYRGLHLRPAAFFALQITRRPGPGLVTCQGGGFIASGSAGTDRLPIPYLPAGLSLLGIEGAGEVQTPLRVPDGVTLELGAPVFLRHAKAGELAEHFLEYLLVRGDRIEARAPTYRGAGQRFI